MLVTNWKKLSGLYIWYKLGFGQNVAIIALIKQIGATVKLNFHVMTNLLIYLKLYY